VFEAQYLFEGDEVFSPWMERDGNALLFTADLVDTLKARLNVKTYHKNKEESGPGTAVGGEIQIAAAGRSTRKSTGLKELVRYHMKCTSTEVTPVRYEYVLFRMLGPVWFDDVAV
jgi:hypothetical protein